MSKLKVCFRVWMILIGQNQLKRAQRNWMGRSEGTLVEFALAVDGLSEEKKSKSIYYSS